jgi:peptide-methionine (S)-S-oxide reductase
VFWRNIDPTVKDQQFCDVGSQYRSGIFYTDDAQKTAADASKAALMKSKPFKGDILTEVTKATQFYPAEEYHQDYYQKNPVRYKFYRNGCGRDAKLKSLWGAEAGGEVAKK